MCRALQSLSQSSYQKCDRKDMTRNQVCDSQKINSLVDRWGFGELLGVFFFFLHCSRIGSTELRTRRLCRPRCRLAVWHFFYEANMSCPGRILEKNLIQLHILTIKLCCSYHKNSEVHLDKHVSSMEARMATRMSEEANQVIPGHGPRL
jgi:hypothetical protein